MVTLKTSVTNHTIFKDSLGGVSAFEYSNPWRGNQESSQMSNDKERDTGGQTGFNLPNPFNRFLPLNTHKKKVPRHRVGGDGETGGSLYNLKC